MATWTEARFEIAARVNLAEIPGDPSVSEAETLRCFERPPATRQTDLPYAYIVPPRIEVRRVAGGQRLVNVPEATVRIMLAGGDGVNQEQLSRRRDAWVDSLILRFDGAVTLGGVADVITAQDFGELVLFEPEQWWGFEMTLALRVSASVAFSAGGGGAGAAGFDAGFDEGFAT